MHKMPTLKAFINVNRFAFISHKVAYSGTCLMTLCYVANVFIATKSLEYTTNSAYHLFEGRAGMKEVLIGVSLFALTNFIFKLLDIAKTLFMHQLFLSMSYKFEYELSEKLSSAKWDYYETHETTVEIHKVRENSLDMMKAFLEITLDLVYAIVGIGVFMGVLAKMNLAVVILYLIVSIIANKSFAKIAAPIYKMLDQVQPYNQKRNYFFSISGDKVTHQEYKFNRLFGFVSHRWEACYNAEYKLRTKILGKLEIGFQAARFLSNLPYFIMLAWVAFEVAQGKYEIGFLFLAQQLLYNIGDAIDIFQGSTSYGRANYGFIESFFNLLNLEEDIPISKHEHINSPLEQIIFNQVIYAYPQARKNSLKGIQLSIQSGEKIAIVGHNGSGKTTFTNLLMALTHSFTGQIHIEGIEAIEVTSVLRNMTSCILQDFAQYQMTIKENIAMGYEGYVFTDEEIWKLIDQVGLKEVVSGLPKQLDTNLGQLQEGVDLSKGQWQRLAIARLIANPTAKIWILDEPTAYLDPLSEIEIYNLIYQLAGDRTVLFISHRLGFAKRADRIVVFDDGMVKEDGTHSTLLKEDGIYAQMYKQQESWYTA